MQTTLIDTAHDLAERAHRGQMRKSLGVPYITHPVAVAALLAEHGYTDDVTLAAAYLHDVVEDCPEFVAEVARTMPAEVVAVVHALTEPKWDEQGTPKPKADRFDAYCRGLDGDSEAVRRALPISCADKIHNTLSIVEAEEAGEPMLRTLRTRPGEHGPNLARLRALYAPVVKPSLLAAFDAAAARLCALIDARRKRDELGLWSLEVTLTKESVARARAGAQLEVLRGEHVTLAHAVKPGRFSDAWIPGGHRVGDVVDVRVVGEASDARVQAYVVEIAGTRLRPSDGGPLHLTLSRAVTARSRDANSLLASGVVAPLPGEAPVLQGVVEWVEA
ncbi:MAG TPA: HD domain-containing protein [Polyangiaceae bacterium]|jgi:GTP pyrophosphokinase|nr:HD domain-containing protein [Polyangiaceae bacterium]